MAITFIDDNIGDNTGADDLSMLIPTLQADDLILAFCGGYYTDTIPNWAETSAHSFTKLHEWTETTWPYGQCAVFYKIAGGSESGAATFSHTSAETGGNLLIYRGVDTGTPFDVAFQDSVLENAVNPTNEPITTANNNSLVVLMHGSFPAGTDTTGGTVSGYTLREAQNDTNAATFVCDKAVVTAGLETPGAWTHTGGSASAHNCMITLALREAGAGGSSVPVISHHLRMNND